MGYTLFQPQQQLYNQFLRIGTVLNAAGVDKNMSTLTTDRASTGENGDKYIVYALCMGDETQLEASFYYFSDEGIWDLYINDVLDSSGYDAYTGGGTDMQIRVTLANPLPAGINKIELRINGKNALSNNYFLRVYGMRLK